MNSFSARPSSHPVSGLCLSVPQWQGWAVSREQAEGSRELAEHFGPRLPVTKVPVSTDERLELDAGILGRAAILENLAMIETALAKAQPDHLYVLGGDCSVDVAPIAYLNARYEGDLAVIWMDAHGDLNTPDESVSHRFHGMPIRALLGEGDEAILSHVPRKLAAGQVFLVGARDLDPPEIAYLQRSGTTHVPVNVLRERLTAVAEAVASKGFKRVHLHLDFDVLDPAEFADLNTPVANGLTISEIVALLTSLSDRFSVAGITLTEYCPKGIHGLTQVAPILDVVERIMAPQCVVHPKVVNG